MVYGGQKMKIKTIPIMMIVAVGVCSAFWIINSVNKIIEKEDNSLSAESLMDIVPASETTPLETEPKIAEAEVRVLKKAAEPEKATKDDIFYMMLL